MTGTRDPLVTVVVIFRDAERFLAEAVESVARQTYRGWELVLVDDGSVDGSTAIAKRWANEDESRVRYLEHPAHANRGMSASRNLGIAHARGELVALLDADDVWHPTKLAEQVSILDREPQAALVYGTRELWERSQEPDEGAGPVVAHGVAADRLFRAPELFLLTFGRRQATVPCSSDLMFRRDVALRLGGFEEGFRGMYEDQAFLVKLELCEAVYVSSRCWTRYRQHAGSCVAEWAASGAEDGAWAAFLSWMGDYVASQPNPPRSVRRAVRSVLRRHRHPRLASLLRLPTALSRRLMLAAARG